jgi:hypothetical protein
VEEGLMSWNAEVERNLKLSAFALLGGMARLFMVKAMFFAISSNENSGLPIPLPGDEEIEDVACYDAPKCSYALR